jgi:hypothetical protein
MQKKIALLVVLIIIVLGAWLYLLLNLPAKEEPREIIPEEKVAEEILPPASPPERYEFEGIEYEIISVGGPIYDIITGEITEEKVEALAEKIIGDILSQEPSTREITLLFYSDLIALGVGKVDVAEIFWTPEGINITTIK